MTNTDRLDPYSRQVAQELEAIAREQGVSQNELARRSGVSQAQISRIYKFLRAVSVEDLDRIAQALGLRGSDILQRAEHALAAADVDVWTLAAKKAPYDREREREERGELP